MMNPSHPAVPWTLLAGACLGLAGCSQGSAEPPPAPRAFKVSYPVEKDVTDYNFFTGRTAAVEMVSVRPHVWGYLDKVNFDEGAEVKKGDVLFIIDRRPYNAALAQADALVKQAEAAQHAQADTVERDKLTPESTATAVMVQDQDNLAAAVAAVGSARAARDAARLNVTYTDVVAPISGRASRALVTAGNMLQSGDQNGGTLLTTIVSMDPIYAYFDVDDQTIPVVRKMFREGKTASSPDRRLQVLLAVATEEGYQHKGRIDFLENQVDSGTGTLRVRGLFPNPDRSLTPGQFARVLVPQGDAHKALLVSDRAIDTDQGQKVLYVVNAANTVEKRPVRLGGLHEGLREITSGVKAGEQVIVDGIQLVRPDAVVEPHLIDMPVSNADDAGADKAPR